MHPRRLPRADRSSIFHFILVIAFLAVGCDTVPFTYVDNGARRPRDNSRELPPVQSPVYEESFVNSDFESAQPATLPISGQIEIMGTIDGRGDIDLYSLGPAVAGDQIIIDVVGKNGLNTVAAMFDEFGDLIDANNDRSFYAGNYDPYIAQVVRRDTDNLFVGVAVSTARHFASSTGQYDTGAYTIKVSRRPDQSVRPPAQQVVWLDFAGGDQVQIALEPIEVMRPFSAESISSRLAGKTSYITDMVVDLLKRDLAPFNVVVLDGRYDARPTGAYSKLYFGNYNAAYLGLADSVDTGNLYASQEAIIYAEDLQLFDGLQPSAEAVALALSNIAAHELGHLLGLEHTNESLDVMSTAATARQILEIDETYRRSRLESAVFPIGWQSGTDLLTLNVGLNPNGANARWRMQDWMPADTVGIDPALGDIEISMCGKCAHAPATDADAHH